MAPRRGQTSATPSQFQELYETLKALDPDIALEYATAVKSENREAILKTGKTAFKGGFGIVEETEIKPIIDAAIDDGKITKDEEEALMIILATKKNWGNGRGKTLLLQEIEKHLGIFDSSSVIDQKKAGQLVMQTGKIHFESRGSKHKGTELTYTSADFQAIVHLIGRKEVKAWEVSGEGFYKQIPGAGTAGYYNITPNEIYLVSGFAPWQMQAHFSGLVTQAIVDYRNGTWEKKYTEADSAIVQGFVALSLKQPYSTMGNTPFLIATRSGGASDMLSKPVAKRDAKWKADFKKAYDDVVDAYVTRVGDATASKPFHLEDPDIQKKENTAFMKALKKVKP